EAPGVHRGRSGRDRLAQAHGQGYLGGEPPGRGWPERHRSQQHRQGAHHGWLWQTLPGEATGATPAAKLPVARGRSALGRRSDGRGGRNAPPRPEAWRNSAAPSGGLGGRGMSWLKPSEMPKPGVASAFMDNHKRIWLWEPDPPSATGKWRLPGGLLVKPGNP